MTLHAIYMVHRRGEHQYREWIIMPQTGMVPANVWTRYITREGARPVWRGSRRGPSADHDQVVANTLFGLDTVVSTIQGHYRQNDRNPHSDQWVWSAPIVVETSEDECREHCFKVPYPVLNRIKRVQANRVKKGVAAKPEDALKSIADALSSMIES